MPVGEHSATTVGLRKEATSCRPCKIRLSSELAPSVEALIRKLVVEARSEADSCAGGSNNGKGPIIIDAEVDGVHCLLTRVEKSSVSQISFSPRESEIARMVAKGYPNKTIAAVLEISPWTVCTHLRRIFSKLHVSSRAAMVARFISDRIVQDIA
jgi:DNA-binding CsgD family transcriptional regulator